MHAICSYREGAHIGFRVRSDSKDTSVWVSVAPIAARPNHRQLRMRAQPRQAHTGPVAWQTVPTWHVTSLNSAATHVQYSQPCQQLFPFDGRWVCVMMSAKVCVMMSAKCHLHQQPAVGRCSLPQRLSLPCGRFDAIDDQMPCCAIAGAQPAHGALCHRRVPLTTAC
jgi:hypothetical protein